MSNTSTPAPSKQTPPIKKAVTFLACLAILGLVALSLHLTKTSSPSGQNWNNSDYKAGQSLDEQAVLALLSTVQDPEIALTVPELGLIYKMDIVDNRVKLLMTLTSPACPWSSQLLTDMRDALFSNSAVAGLQIDITFDPPWSLERIDQAALARLQASYHGEEADTPFPLNAEVANK